MEILTMKLKDTNKFKKAVFQLPRTFSTAFPKGRNKAIAVIGDIEPDDPNGEYFHKMTINQLTSVISLLSKIIEGYY
jgi:hypothetical protein